VAVAEDALLRHGAEVFALQASESIVGLIAEVELKVVNA
jgi:hypothetical protein